MPYNIIHKGDKHIVINKQTKKVKGTHDTMAKAMSQMRLLYGVEHGMKPTGKAGEPMAKA